MKTTLSEPLKRLKTQAFVEGFLLAYKAKSERKHLSRASMESLAKSATTEAMRTQAFQESAHSAQFQETYERVCYSALNAVDLWLQTHPDRYRNLQEMLPVQQTK